MSDDHPLLQALAFISALRLPDLGPDERADFADELELLLISISLCGDATADPSAGTP